MVSKDGILVDPNKVEAIDEWSPSIIIFEVCSFLRLASYCKKFIDRFSCIAILLTYLTQNEFKFEWTKECE